MQLDHHVAQVQEQLAAAAALGDDRTREIAAALATASGPALRLALVGALSAAADEITAALLDEPGAPAVSVRFDGDDAEITVGKTGGAAAPAPPDDGGGDATARISLRLSPALKIQIDTAADADGVSVNTWLVRAATWAVQAGGRGAGRAGRGDAHRNDARRVTGWING